MAPSPIRLLMIASSSHIGGAEQSILGVVRYADPARLFPSVLSVMGKGPLARLAEQAGAKAYNWALESVANPLLIRRMQLFLRDGHYDLVQCFGLRAELLTRWVAHGMGLKLISSIRSTDPWRRWHHVALDRLTVDGVTAWISNSQAGMEAKIEREGTPAEKIFVVPNGIPDRAVVDAKARHAARRKFKLADEDAPVLGVVANITRAKGSEDLIEAIARLRTRFPRLVCLCAGRIDAEGRIPKLASSKGLDANFRWLGFLPDAAAVYEASDLAVLASHWEGMPHALIEALRAGVASVATDVGGVPEVIRHQREGLLCPPKSPEALAASIERALADNASRAAWGKAARERYEYNFRIEDMVDRLTAIYERICGRPAA